MSRQPAPKLQKILDFSMQSEFRKKSNIANPGNKDEQGRGYFETDQRDRVSLSNFK
jgi:hypothetical protein